MIKQLLIVMLLGLLIVPVILAENSTNATIAENSTNVTIIEQNTTASVPVETAAAPTKDSIILEKQLEIRKAQLSWVAAVKERDMSAAISYVDHIAGNSSKLTTLLDNFKSQEASVQNLTTNEEINEALKQMKTIIADFKTETRVQLDGANGKTADLLKSIQDAYAADILPLKELENKYNSIWRSNTLAIFDIRFERTQNAVTEAGKSGINITKAQAKLDELNYERKKLDEAFGLRNSSLIAKENNQILTLSKELKDILGGEQASSSAKAKLMNLANAGSRVAKITDKVISELKLLNVDTSDLDSINTEIINNVGDVKLALDSGYISNAKTTLAILQTSLNKLITSYEDLLSQDILSGAMKNKIEAMKGSLDKIAKGMSADL